MSGYLNSVQLIGNLGADPEVRRTQFSKAIVTLYVVTSESWKDPNSGEQQERTEWHVQSHWGKAAIRRTGCAAAVSSTHSHLSTRTIVQRSSYDRF